MQGHKLHQNFPNPFNPTTTIAYELDAPSDVELVIYDIQGREIWSVKNHGQVAGQHQIIWDGRDFSNKAVDSGVYFSQLSNDGRTQTIKMLLSK